MQNQLDSYDADGQPKQLAMGARDRFRGTDSRIYSAARSISPARRARGYVQVLSTRPMKIKSSSGRLELADELASRDNPLTARVMANRVWLHLMGRGLVATPDNFGAAGQTPSHPELLDYLAVTFMDDGWSVKKLIRRIVLSHAYQLDSRPIQRITKSIPTTFLSGAWRRSGKMPRRCATACWRSAASWT